MVDGSFSVDNQPPKEAIPVEVSSRQRFIDNVETLLKNGGDVGVAADFDQNISRGGLSKGLDPRDREIDPVVRQAFMDMREAGKDVVIISSRGAKDVARILNIPGIVVVGTLGWETLDAKGVSHIHPRFRTFQPQITGILKDIRERFFSEQLHMSTAIVNEPSNELATPEGGKIILQRKGYNDEYPEGINSTWALNLVDEGARDKYQDALKQYYSEAFAKYSGSMNESDRAKLQEMCGLMIRVGKTAEGLPTLDVEIRPTSQGAKANAMLQLMRENVDPKRQEHFKDMPYHPFWIYSGDHAVQDSAPMRAGHTASYLTRNKRGVLGVWSKPPHEEERPVRGVDVVVDGVSGNAQLMKETAAIITRYAKVA